MCSLCLEKAVAVEEELKAEARKETAQEEALKEKTGSDVATQEVKTQLFSLCAATQ